MDNNLLPQTFLFNGKQITLREAQTISIGMHGLSRDEMADIMGNSSKSTIDQRFVKLYTMYEIHNCTKFMLMARDHGFDSEGCFGDVYLFSEWKDQKVLPWNKKKGK